MTVRRLDGPAATTGESGTSDGDGAIDWDGCGEQLQCGTLVVPLDYADPDGPTIELYLERRLADGDPIGSLLVNPGGPGVPGSSLAPDAEFYFSDRLLEHFDIVAFDPRGTGRSAGIDCVDDLDQFYAVPDPSPDTDAEVAEQEQAAQRFADACAASAGDLLAHVSTVDAARDMDAIRVALGAAQISYLGFSYGSELGAAWLSMFPTTVRAAVLDGALAPVDDDQQLIDQAAGLERTLAELLAACSADEDCPFHSGGDAEGAFDELIGSLDREPIPSDDPDRPVTEGVAWWGVVASLYAEQLWPVLHNALADAAVGDGQGLLDLYDSYFERDPAGNFADTIESNVAINCADSRLPTDPAVKADLQARLNEVAPHFGPLMLTPDQCAVWPVPMVEAPPVTGAGAGPVLVVGATGDPVTTLAATRRMAEALEDGVLLIREGEGHTSYGSSECITDTVDDYLVDLVVPAPESVCGS